MNTFQKCLVISALVGFSIAAPCRAVRVKFADCFSKTESQKLDVCQLEVLATYQAIQVLQSRYGMKRKTCQFSDNLTPKKLTDALLGHMQKYVAMKNFGSSEPWSAADGLLTLGGDCKLGLAKKASGATTGSVLKLCLEGFKSGGDPLPCGAYIAGVRNTFVGLPPHVGAREVWCGSDKPPDVKAATLMLIRETKRNPKSQQARPAADVMADAFARVHPCH